MLRAAVYLPIVSTVADLEPSEPIGWAIVLVLALLPQLVGEATQ